MYTRLVRQFFTRFISDFSHRNVQVAILSTYRIPLGIISNRHISRNYVTPISQFSTCPYRKSHVVTTHDEENIKMWNVNYEELIEAQKNDNVLIVDVREQNEIDETGKLPGSIHIPMDNVSDVLVNLSEESFRKKYNKDKPTKETKIIFSCRSGKRSGMVQKAMQKLGYKNVYNYVGGWMDWESKTKS